jgi:membrane protein implicated in regulation of membrane protease activity
MAWYFIIPLGLALVVYYILKHATDEIAYIATAILVVSLIVSLIISPWQFQFLLLLLVLLSNIRIWQKTEDLEDDLSPADPKINMSYRGINYAVQPKSAIAANEEVKEAEMIIGKYRGQVLKTHSPQHTQVQSETTRNFEIQYRGIKVKPQPSSLTEVTENTR